MEIFLSGKRDLEVGIQGNLVFREETLPCVFQPPGLACHRYVCIVPCGLCNKLPQT